jgi:Zn-dependent protease with chaperone function
MINPAIYCATFWDMAQDGQLVCVITTATLNAMDDEELLFVAAKELSQHLAKEEYVTFCLFLICIDLFC